ncbi:hypothetical protein RirG_271660 [Rhizophagus irregularis DAOM 197198w]|uniref:Uncharacterized protein n=1 Tax=Rhizophagus irregularis (strain DAOM 197198w) TaxID=1432141 RepID=A0A015I0A4_RHIIW|nr:hypothetical protein RirG_271660 [Rhizophagus irregularis DAOM 197198w]EXX50348.1 hypothetical protein RirG_271660 [Rhizophagus irregularis DAOM 197198w]
MNMIFKNNSNFLNFSLREHKPADIYQPILTNGGNNVNISGTTARTQMTHRAYLMFSLDPAWRDGIKTFLNFSLREHKPADIYQPILKSGGNNIIINGTTDGGTFNSGPSEKKRDRLECRITLERRPLFYLTVHK